MRFFSAILFLCLLSAPAYSQQLASFNADGLTYGHVHLLAGQVVPFGARWCNRCARWCKTLTGATEDVGRNCQDVFEISSNACGGPGSGS